MIIFEKHVKINSIYQDKIYLFKSGKNYHWYLFDKDEKLWKFYQEDSSGYPYGNIHFDHGLWERELLQEINIYLTYIKRPYFSKEKVYELDSLDELHAVKSMEELVG